MSLSARLHIEGHSKEDEGIRIISCDYAFSQDIDPRGLQTSKVKAGQINITLNGTNDGEFIQWMIGYDTLKKGKITFSGVIDTGPQRTIEFEDALLVYYHESFTDESDIIINLTISARVLRISGLLYENVWTNKSE